MALIRPKQLDAALAGAGIARDTAGVLSVDPGTGLTVTGDEVLIDTGSTVTFSGATWTFPVDELQVTGTPDSASDAVNKAYVDSIATGLQWREPADVGADGYVGNLGEVAIEALTPTAGDTYVVSAVDGDSTIDGTAAAIGDIFEYSGSVFVKIVANSGGFPPAGTRAIASVTTALVSPLTDATDDGKIVEWDGASLTPDLTLGEATDGSAILINGESALNENKAYVFDGTVPTGVWFQFAGSGAGAVFTTVTPDSGGDVVADSGTDTLTLAGGDGVNTVGTPGTDTVTLSVDLEAAGAGEGGLAIDGGEIRVFANTAAGIELTASGVAVDLEAAGAATGGLAFDSGEIRVFANTAAGIELLAGGVSVDLEAAGAGTGGLAFDSGEIRVDVGDGIELTASGVAADLAAAGAGTGGLEFATGEIAVDAGDGIELTASGVAVDPANDSIDVSASGVKAPVLNLTNKKEASAIATAAGNDTTGITIDATPAGDGMVHVLVNGVEYDLSADKVGDFYFSSDGGTTAKALAAIASGDTLYLGTGMPFDLDASDEISLIFAQIV